MCVCKQVSVLCLLLRHARTSNELILLNSGTLGAGQIHPANASGDTRLQTCNIYTKHKLSQTQHFCSEITWMSLSLFSSRICRFLDRKTYLSSVPFLRLIWQSMPIRNYNFDTSELNMLAFVPDRSSVTRPLNCNPQHLVTSALNPANCFQCDKTCVFQTNKLY